MAPDSSKPTRRFGRAILRQFLVLAALALGMFTVPHRWCMRDADAWCDGDPALQDALARGVERLISSGVTLDDFDTGVDQFNGEWLFGSYLMAGFGFGQVALSTPDGDPRRMALVHRHERAGKGIAYACGCTCDAGIVSPKVY